MSRVVTYLTDPAPNIGGLTRISRSTFLLIEMFRSGAKATMSEARAHVNYALESPAEIPAGACRQFVIDTGDEENGMPGYGVGAEQITIPRE